MIKRFIIRGVSKKFKGIQKLKPQKVPKSSFAQTEIEAQERGIKTFIEKFGEKPEYMGFGEASAIRLAGEELAGATSRKHSLKL